MKASELITRLENFIAQHGDMKVQVFNPTDKPVTMVEDHITHRITSEEEFIVLNAGR
jgi:hypothetical protein